MAKEHAVVIPGAKLFWRRQGIFWWAYAVNLLLAILGTLPVVLGLSRALSRTLISERLYKGLDFPTFMDLTSHPAVPVRLLLSGSFFLAVLFFVFMLFWTGGILETYRRDQKLDAGGFFQACGAFFWRFVRLLLFLVIALIPVAIVLALIQGWSNKLSRDAAQEMLGFWVMVSGGVVAFLLFSALRLWFDVAQVRAVVENERPMRWTILRAFKQTFGNFFRLFWILLRIFVLGWFATALLLCVWVRFVAPDAVWLSFLLTQLILLIWLALRFWLRACEMLWYLQRYPRSPEPADSTEGS